MEIFELETFGFLVGAVLGLGIVWVSVRTLWYLGSFLKAKAKKERLTVLR